MPLLRPLLGRNPNWRGALVEKPTHLMRIWLGTNWWDEHEYVPDLWECLPSRFLRPWHFDKHVKVFDLWESEDGKLFGEYSTINKRGVLRYVGYIDDAYPLYRIVRDVLGRPY